ncbi:MAG: hypothetical protein WDO71_19925 [Bacteroidota bacterium]
MIQTLSHTLNMKKTVLILFSLVTSLYLQAQDTLPNFSLTNAGSNRIVVGWTNTFETIRQISIQRSFDSVKNFKTILTVPDATTLQNGYVDTKATNDHMFYRLYILLDKGVYLFSDAKKPVWDTSTVRKLGSPGNPSLTLPVIPNDPVSTNPVVYNNIAKTELWVPSNSFILLKMAISASACRKKMTKNTTSNFLLRTTHRCSN